MADFEGLVQRATHRLKRDRELRMEVSRELESHLEASVAEYREADYAEADAVEAATKDFGDPDDVAQALWDANRFRLKLRAWAWWAARLTLLPGCLLAAMWFVWSGAVTTGMVGQFGMDGPEVSVPAAWAEARLKAKMTDEQRLIAFGDESAADPIERWRATRDAYPDEPLYQLELVSQMLAQLPSDPAGDRAAYREAKDRLVLELERGEAVDPDNGVYAMIRAGVALRGMDVGPDDSPGDGFEVEMLSRNGTGQARSESITLYPWPSDAEADQILEAMTQLASAAQKPYLSLRVSDRIEHRFAQMPPPNSMREFVFRLSIEISTLLPHLQSTRLLARGVAAEAIARAEAGDVAGAYAVLADLDAVNAKLASSSNTAITLLVAYSIEAIERQTRVAVARVRGDRAAEAQALADSDALVRHWREVWHESEAVRQNEDAMVREGGVLMSMMLPTLPNLRTDTTPFRKAEYTLVDRAMLTWGLFVLVGLSAAASAVSVWTVWRRSEQRPMLLAIGATRWAVLIGGAVVLPVLLFVAWSWTPWAGRGVGLNYSFGAVVWYLPLGLGMAVLMWELSVRAMVKRAGALGLVTPSRRGVGWLVVMIVTLVAVAATAYAASGSLQRGTGTLAWWVLALVYLVLCSAIAIGAAWGVREIAWLRGIDRPSAAIKRGGVVGGASALALGGVLMVLVQLIADPIDRGVMWIGVGVIAGLAGVAIGFWRLATWPGRCVWFARSVVRTMGPVLAVAGLLLALGVGTGLNLRERALAGRMIERSPVWFTHEIEQSDLRLMREYLAGYEKQPPRRVPGG